jgi:Tol biopolymer transport system component
MKHSRGWRKLGAALLAAAVTTMTGAAQESPRALFERARVLEENPRALERAVGLYEQAAKRAGSDRALAGNARLRIGIVRERQGRPEARAVYTNVLRDYRDVPGVATAVAARLAALNGQGGSETPPRLVGTPGFAEAFDMSADGRYVVGPERRGYNAYAVVLQDLQSGETRVLGQAFQSRISTDGSRVIFGCPNSGSRSICVVRTAPGSSAEPIVKMPENVDVVPVDWHPSGNLVLVALRRTENKISYEELAWLSLTDRSFKPIRRFEKWQVPGRTLLSSSISPDGRFIAFTTQRSRESADSGLYVIGSDGQNETAVINAAGEPDYSVWTPDGRHVLFTGDVGGVRGLWAVSVQEGRAVEEPRLVNREASTVPGMRPLGVTTSGSLIYRRTEGNLNYEFVTSREPIASRAVPFVGIHAAWSATGLAAFLRETRDGVDLVIRDMATGIEKRYRRRGFDFYHDLVWLPDASGVLVYAQDETPATRGIYLFDTRTETFRKLTDVGGNGRWRKGSFTVSHDGRTLYVPVSEVGWEESAPVSGVAAIDLASGDEQLLMSFDAVNELPADVSLDLSPDGKTLAVSVAAPKGGSVRILAVAVDGRSVREVASALPTGWVGNNTRWTPDGRSLLVVSFDSNRDWRIVRIPAEGGEPVFDGLDYRTLATLLPDLRVAPGNFNGFDVSPDGSQLIVSTWTLGKQELWAIDNVMSGVR